jgi:hypothetical protein
MMNPSDRQTSIHRVAAGTLLTLQRGRAKKTAAPTAEAPLIVSVSELRDFMDCRVKWWMRHQARLEPVEGSVNLAIGSLTHTILEAWYGVPFAKRTAKRMEKIARGHINTTTRKELALEDKELIEAMCNGYALWTLDAENENSDADLGYVDGFPEEWFTVALDAKRTVLLRGRFDNRFVPTRAKRTMALLEVKTAKDGRMSKFEQNIQIGGYHIALFDQFAPKFKRFIVYPTVLRKQMPSPRVKAPLFIREPVELTRDEVEMVRRDMHRAALDMLDAAIYASPADRCEWACDYRNPCMLRHSPGDLTHVLASEFKPKEYR